MYIEDAVIFPSIVKKELRGKKLLDEQNRIVDDIHFSLANISYHL